jgi:phosphoglycolate phosphatase
MRYSNILFDLDGTLTDPKLGITKSVRYALDKFGIHVEDLSSLIPFIGPPLRSSFMEYYGFPEEKADTAVAYYREYFGSTGIFENGLYEGIDPLLKRLNGRGMAVFVATSKPTVYAVRICEHFGIARYFRAVNGSNLDGTLTDKSELIGRLMDDFGLRRAETVMVGDRMHDIIGAVNNEISSIGVGYGYGSREELCGAGATFYAEAIADVEKILMESR